MNTLPPRQPTYWVGLAFSILLTSCSTTPPKVATNPDDPWQDWNHKTTTFNQDFDKTVLKPMAKEYQEITPGPVDTGVTNFFSNINDIGISINDLLQLKFLQGGMDLSRFIVNSTAGVAGIFDVASKLDLPKHNEDFGQTLGFWGVPSGSYMVLPFLGSSTPRDAAGLLGDALLNPLTYVSFFGGIATNAATASTTILDVTDTRSDLMSTEKLVEEGAVNRYDFVKNAYLQHREYLIHDGDPPDNNDPLQDTDIPTNTNTASTATADSAAVSSGGMVLSNDQHEVGIINNSKTLPANVGAPVPVINNSKRFLELSPPD
jgi:phospholipid-binding lipoprotein MlaA